MQMRPNKKAHQSFQEVKETKIADQAKKELVARTDALWNKLACPREPTGSLSEAIYSPHTQTHRLSGVPRVQARLWPWPASWPGTKASSQPER